MLCQPSRQTGRRWTGMVCLAWASLSMSTAPGLALAQTSPGATATQSSTEQGVTVQVTAKSP